MLGVQSIDSNLNHEQHPPPRQERRKYSRPISSLVQKALQTEFQDCVKYIKLKAPKFSAEYLSYGLTLYTLPLSVGLDFLPRRSHFFFGKHRFIAIKNILSQCTCFFQLQPGFHFLITIFSTQTRFSLLLNLKHHVRRNHVLGKCHTSFFGPYSFDSILQQLSQQLIQAGGLALIVEHPDIISKCREDLATEE